MWRTPTSSPTRPPLAAASPPPARARLAQLLPHDRQAGRNVFTIYSRLYSVWTKYCFGRNLSIFFCRKLSVNDFVLYRYFLSQDRQAGSCCFHDLLLIKNIQLPFVPGRGGHRHMQIGRMLDIDLISEPPHAPSPQIYVSKVRESVWPEGQEAIHSQLGSQDVTYLSLHPMPLHPRVEVKG